MKKTKSLSIRNKTGGCVIFSVVYWFIACYFFLIQLSLSSLAFWTALDVYLFVIWAVLHHWPDKKKAVPADSKAVKRLGYVTLAAFVIPAVLFVFNTKIFRAGSYAAVVEEPREAKFEDTVPKETEQFDKLALIDTDTSAVIGERELGSLTDLVSQYEIDQSEYATINIDGYPAKVAPLEYASFMRWLSNYKTGTPGYVKINPSNGDAELIRLKEGMKYMPSARFSKDLRRHLYFFNPTQKYGSYFFEVDEEGNPYWTVPVISKRNFVLNEKITGLVTVNAITGETKQYALQDVPSWVDIVFNGDYLTSRYDDHWKFRNGFWNAITTKKGCLETTSTFYYDEDGDKVYNGNDYGYITIDDDIWIYTGVTSAANDASNVGMLMVNERTGEGKYFPIAGADEGSAMGAAEGELQQYGYKASFPSLININDKPVYIMVMTDANHIVKNYAMVDMQDYSNVVTGKTRSDVITAYEKMMGSDTSEEEKKVESRKMTGYEVQSANGKTIITVTLEDGSKVKYETE